MPPRVQTRETARLDRDLSRTNVRRGKLRVQCERDENYRRMILRLRDETRRNVLLQARLDEANAIIAKFTKENLP